MPSVFYGGEAELTYLTAGDPHPSLLQYVQQQANAIGNYIQRTGNTFAQGVVDMTQRFYNEENLYYAKVAASRVKSYFMPDRIYALNSIYDIQQAQPIMQRYILAEPSVAKMVDQERCEGYGLANPFPGQYGADNYNWRRVMNGVAQLEEPSDAYPDGNYKFEIFMEELKEGDRELILPEQDAILSTWANIRYSLARSMVDPTSKSGDFL